MKKLTSLLLALVMVMSLVACSSPKTEADNGGKTIKAGFIFLHDENSTYDLNFINGAKEACEKAGVEYVFKTNIPEGQECYDAACELIDEGCNFIFGDSFGHEGYLIEAAKDYPDVQFCHATGTRAHTEGLSNFHNAFASIYEGRYLAGVAGGVQLKEMIDKGDITADQAKVGYVGAYTYAEVISGYTSFFLGVQSIVPEATMEVTFTGSWYDEAAEKEAANSLINNGCVLISQHADSLGAPTACENAGVKNVAYNGSTEAAAPTTFVVSSRINWAPYFEFCLNAMKDGSDIPTDYVGTIATGSVQLTDFGAACSEGTKEAVEAAKAKIESGELKIFDTSKFTKDGAKLDSYMADVDTDDAYTPDHEVIIDGVFNESGEGFRSAPYFDIQIDGITLLDNAF